MAVGSEQCEAPIERQPVVLVAEDNQLFLKMTRLALERAGLAVLIAKDGKEALEMFGSFSEEIDVVVTDLMMPRMSGIELCRQVKALKRSVSVLLITGVEHGSTAAPEAFGFDGALRKPFGAAQLEALIRGMLPPPLPTAAPPLRHSGCE